jgi:hypothetical protein
MRAGAFWRVLTSVAQTTRVVPRLYAPAWMVSVCPVIVLMLLLLLCRSCVPKSAEDAAG